MNFASTFIPIDRRQAIATGESLPNRTEGAVLFADISGFTPLTAALLKELGLKRGPEELTRQLNLVYDALVKQVHRFGGSVLGFAGDAITCWFNGDDGRRATACGLAMQQAMQQFAAITTPAGRAVSLGMKAAVAAGPVRRFLVGDPVIQYVDALAGATLERMAAGEHQAERGDVVVAPEVAANLSDLLAISEFRADHDTGLEFAVVTGLTAPVAESPWPALPPERQLTAEQARPWLLRPVFDRLNSGQGQFLAEIRPAVALFLRFGGIEFDTDDLAGEKLDAYIGWVQNILARHEGYLLQVTIGDKGSYLYASFGAPLTHGDDPARAVAAAVELQSPPLRLAFVGPVQLGISQGRMRAGAYGGQARSTYGVLGDEVNMAARLMQLAPPGQVMVSQPIADAVSEAYQLEYLGPTKVKGKDEPIPVYRVLGRRRQEARKPVSVFPNPLLGRDTELAQMAQVLSAVMAGPGQILRVQGVAGIGKSHLVSEFAQRALLQGWRVVLGACQSTGSDIPYLPWRQIFRALLVLLDTTETDDDSQIEQVTRTVSELNPAWQVRLPLLGDLLNLPIPDNPTTAAFEPQLRQEALFTFAVDLLGTWAQFQPLLIILEDVHWLDEASRGLALALARVADQMPLALAVAHRPPLDRNQPILSELDALRGYHFLDLAELSPEGVTGLVTFKLQGRPTPLLLELVQSQALGNPFFVEELIDTLRTLGHLRQRGNGQWDLADAMLAALREANCLTTDGQGRTSLNPDVPLSAADLGLPDSIQGLVLARLDRMLEEHKLTVKVASVIGRVFQFQLLARAHPLQPEDEFLLAQIAEIEAREFARLEVPLPVLAHIFKHNITRDVAYETLLDSQQRELHHAVGKAIEAEVGDAVELLAYHYNRAKVADKAMLYLGLAARKAQHDYANATALTYYRQALAWAERWEWRKGEIEVLHLLGHREQELLALQTLATLPDASPFEVAYLWGQYYEATADYPQAQTAVEQALAAARSAGEALKEIRCLAQFGVIAHKQGQYDMAATQYTQALNQLQGQETYTAEESKVLSEILNGLGIIHRQQGDFEQALAYHQQALALSRQTSNRYSEARAFNDMGVVAFYQRQFSHALSYHQQAMEIRRAIGDRTGEGKSLYNMAMATRDAGDYGQTQAYLTDALVILQATGNRWDEVNVWNELGILYQELGELTRAETFLQQGLDIARDIGDEAGVAYLLSNLGLTQLDAGNLDAADKALADGLAVVLAQAENDKYQAAVFLSYQSAVSLKAGRFEQAIRQAAEALQMRREIGLTLLTTDDLATLAAAHLAGAGSAAALDYARQALAILDECGGDGPEFPRRDYFVCYQVFSADNQPQLAASALQSAYNLVMARAAKISDSTLRLSFLEKAAFNQEIVAAYQQAKS